MGREQIVGLIIDECRKRYGAGQVFYRGDGLAFEGRRAAKRAAYLQAHPETSPEHRELIERGGLTPGMSHGESIAAWGLIEEDMGGVTGRSTADAQHSYAYYHGFDVGTPYVLYLIDNTVVGVEEDTGGVFHGRAWHRRQFRLQKFPPDEWFAAVADGARQFVAFRDINGETELVEAEWVRENVFRILEMPLLVNGVSLWDEVEAGWEGDDPTPRFARVSERSGIRFRQVRVRASEREVEAILRNVEELNDELAYPTTRFLYYGHRHGRGVFVFCLSEFTLEDLPWLDWPRLAGLVLPHDGAFVDTGACEWVFTDTGTRQ